jgi:hypothetical protein
VGLTFSKTSLNFDGQLQMSFFFFSTSFGCPTCPSIKMLSQNDRKTRGKSIDLWLCKKKKQ